MKPYEQRNAPVPATTRVRPSRVQNIPTDRLLARLDHVRMLVATAHRWCEQKSRFKAVVVEAWAIEDELHRRGVEHVRVTRRVA